MRYYRTEHINGTLLVVAEIIGRTSPLDGSPIPHELADGGDGVTRDQLLELPGGRRALWAWERGDDEPSQRAADDRRRAWDIAEVRELAATGNHWAQDLADRGFQERDCYNFATGDKAFPASVLGPRALD
jgi:hypothetical protein